MSWSAHQFESYVLQKHFGRKIAISYLAIVVGDMIPDSFTKISSHPPRSRLAITPTRRPSPRAPHRASR